MYNVEMATLNDIEQLVKLRLLEQAEDWKDNYAITHELATETKEAFEQRLNKNLYAFIIKKNNQIVATACLLLQRYLPQADDCTGKRGYLCNVYTIESERRKGLQKKIFNEIIIFAKYIGLYRIDLHSALDENVIHMYKKLGFNFVDNNARLIIK